MIETKINPWGSNSKSIILLWYIGFINNAAGLHAGYKRDSVLEQASRCLHNLQVESVDLLYLHAPDHSTPIEETLAAVQELYKGVYSSYYIVWVIML